MVGSVLIEGTMRIDISEQRLQAAVLIRAINDLSDNIQGIRRDARTWFRSKNTHPFSFLGICESCGIDHRKILKELSMAGLFDS